MSLIWLISEQARSNPWCNFSLCRMMKQFKLLFEMNVNVKRFKTCVKMFNQMFHLALWRLTLLWMSDLSIKLLMMRVINKKVRQSIMFVSIVAIQPKDKMEGWPNLICWLEMMNNNNKMVRAVKNEIDWFPFQKIKQIISKKILTHKQVKK